MNYRTLVVLTTLVILGIALLFAINFANLLRGEVPNQTYLRYNQVRGIAVSREQLLYTLNFQQQKQVIDSLNTAVAITDIRQVKRDPPDFEKIVIYQFEGEPDIIIKPLAYVDGDLIFSAPQWQPPKDYLMELSAWNLRNLLSTTYDH